MTTPIWPFDTDGYHGATSHLTTVEHGAYFLILMAMWRSADGAIDSDAKSLAKLVRLPFDKWKKIAGTIMPLLQLCGNKVTQKRVCKDKENLASAKPDNWHVQSQITGFASNLLKNHEAGFFDNELDQELRKERRDSQHSTEETKKVSRRDSQRRRAPRQIICEDWQPNDKDLQYAADLRFDAYKIGQMRNAFVNHHRSRGTMIADLSATWRTWCDNEIKFAARRGPNGGGSRSLQDDARSVSRAAERLHGTVTQFPARPRLVPPAGQTNLRAIPEG